jgi:beta-lactam-binding protein with PASTA domain
VPLLDGKYEIISEHPVDETQTRFEATAPDGTAVTVFWFEFADAELEWAFQHYRQTLRALKRQNLAAIIDVVSRPGANYVAWLRAPHTRVTSLEAYPALVGALESLGREPKEADVRLSGEGQALIYGLAFDRSAPPLELAPAPEPPAEPPQRAPLYARFAPWLTGLGLGLAGLFLLYLSFLVRADNSLVIVPEAVGREVGEVADELYGLGLAARAEGVSSAEEAGRVLSIDPRPGTQLRRGRTMVLRYALPPGAVDEARVPELRGRLFDASSGDIEEVLAQERLELGRVARLPAAAPRGTVLAQTPPAGSRVGAGGAVDVLISEGPAEARTFLPDLRGLELADALFLAQLAGFDDGRVSVVHVGGTGAPAGTVLDQSLAPLMPVSRDLATLSLTVAEAPSTALATDRRLPSLWGMSFEEAQRTVLQTGFSLGTVEEISSAGLPRGVVMQEPGAGALGGGAVNLVVNVVNVGAAEVADGEAERNGQSGEVCAFAYSFVLEQGIPAGDVIVAAQTPDGSIPVIKRTRAGGGEVIEGVWEVAESGPIRFFLSFNGYPYGVPLEVACRSH